VSDRASIRVRLVASTAVVFALTVAWALSDVPSCLAEAAPLTPAEVVERGRELDGTQIDVTGEVLGEDLYAGKAHRWVNVAGGGTAVGLWVEQGLVEQIEHFGKYGVQGDTLTVRGTLNVACTQHGGEFDVHVSEVTSLEPGEVREQGVSWWKLGVGLAGIAIGFVEYRFYRRRRERLRP